MMRKLIASIALAAGLLLAAPIVNEMPFGEQLVSNAEAGGCHAKRHKVRKVAKPCSQPVKVAHKLAPPQPKQKCVNDCVGSGPKLHTVVRCVGDGSGKYQITDDRGAISWTSRPHAVGAKFRVADNGTMYWFD